MKRKLLITSYLLVLVWVIDGCKKHSIEKPNTIDYGQDYYVSATASASLTKVQLQALATLKGFAAYVPLINYDVDFYKVIYNTTYKGQKIQASGTLAIPKGTSAPPPLLSAQHGTMFADADAPSNFPLAFTGFELFGAAGFVTAIPDFIGFGASKDIVHPYYDTQYSAAAVVDMLKAVKYFLKLKNTSISNKLFLVGYSEGGYVSLAAQKALETAADSHLVLTAAAEGAGGYDVTGMLAKIATIPSYVDPSFLALFMQAYNTTYDYNRPLTDFFMPQYASIIPQLLDGSKNSTQINSQLTTSTAAFFNATFYANLLVPTAETTFKADVAKNSFNDWYPKSPTRLYHGTADEDVFFETSQTTYAKFIAAGSSQLTLLPIPGGTHETSVGPMMLDALPWFQSLALQP